jgi:hypothetical protein
MTEMKFNKIYIIQYLGESEYKTGQRLYEDLLQWAPIKDKRYSVDFKSISNKEELFQRFGFIAEESRQKNILPILHLECHGCKDGLRLSNNELVNWEELRGKLTKINIYCRNNLLLVLAACQGGYIIELLSPECRAPFAGVIAPEKERTSGQIEKDFKSFYKEFLNSFDGNKAIEMLNKDGLIDSSYIFVGCDYIFGKVFREYFNKLCKGKTFERRIENLVTQAINSWLVDLSKLSIVRKYLKNYLKNPEISFDRLKNNFFMLDLYPENIDRFNIKFIEVKENQC